MLSKLRHFRDQQAAPAAHPALECLRAALGPGITRLEPVTGGTLGTVYAAVIDGRPRFLKTHAWTNGAGRLRQELEILSSLMEVAPLWVEEGGTRRLWLMMDHFSAPPHKVGIGAVLALISDYQRRLAATPPQLSIPLIDDLPLLVEEARDALAALAGLSLIGAQVRYRAGECLESLAIQIPRWPRRLCHGDLSPGNILWSGTGLVAVDWEDAVWGTDGYDYVYWLTFMQNTPLVNPGAFDRTPLGRELEIALAVMVILIKSRISQLSGSYVRDRVSFDQRLNGFLRHA